jgi:hypothetical protein
MQYFDLIWFDSDWKRLNRESGKLLCDPLERQKGEKKKRKVIAGVMHKQTHSQKNMFGISR